VYVAQMLSRGAVLSWGAKVRGRCSARPP